jgi:hypothetical protein
VVFTIAGGEGKALSIRKISTRPAGCIPCLKAFQSIVNLKGVPIMNSYNPIISRKAYKGGLFVRIPVPMENRAIILSSSVSKRVRLIDSSHCITACDIRREKFDEEIEIDLRSRRFSFGINATCKDQHYQFIIQLGVQAAVEDALDYYQSRQDELLQAIKERISSQVYQIAGTYDIKDYLEFSDKLLKALGENRYTDEGIAWSIVSVQAEPDEEVKGHLGEIAETKFTANVKKAKIIAQKEVTLTGVLSGQELEAILGNDEAAAVYASLLSEDNSLANAFIERIDYYVKKSDVQMREATKIIEILTLLSDKDALTDNDVSARIQKILGTLTSNMLNASNADFKTQQTLKPGSGGNAGIEVKQIVSSVDS